MIAGGTSKSDIVLYLFDITVLFCSNPHQFLLAWDLQKNIWPEGSLSKNY
jgi:hypothetical protein